MELILVLTRATIFCVIICSFLNLVKVFQGLTKFILFFGLLQIIFVTSQQNIKSMNLSFKTTNFAPNRPVATMRLTYRCVDFSVTCHELLQFLCVAFLGFIKHVQFFSHLVARGQSVLLTLQWPQSESLLFIFLSKLNIEMDTFFLTVKTQCYLPYVHPKVFSCGTSQLQGTYTCSMCECMFC